MIGQEGDTRTMRMGQESKKVETVKNLLFIFCIIGLIVAFMSLSIILSHNSSEPTEVPIVPQSPTLPQGKGIVLTLNSSLIEKATGQHFVGGFAGKGLMGYWSTDYYLKTENRTLSVDSAIWKVAEIGDVLLMYEKETFWGTNTQLILMRNGTIVHQSGDL